MFDRSPPPGCEQMALFPTSSSEARPAKSSPASAGAAGSTPTACSSRPSVSSESADLAGLLLRTALTSALAAQTGFLGNWKRRATPAGRSWWVLEMPAERIGASGPGSWAPTPRASKGGLPDSHGVAPFIHTPKRKDNLLSPSMVKWAGSPLHHLGKPSLSSIASSVGLSGRALLASIYERMMGFPPGWLSAAARRMETPSPPSSPS